MRGLAAADLSAIAGECTSTFAKLAKAEPDIAMAWLLDARALRGPCLANFDSITSVLLAKERVGS